MVSLYLEMKFTEIRNIVHVKWHCSEDQLNIKCLYNGMQLVKYVTALLQTLKK
jgi:hypothetical protein